MDNLHFNHRPGNRTPDTCKMCLFYILAISLLFLTGFAAKDEQYLSITAVTTDSNDHAYLECWRFPQPSAPTPQLATPSPSQTPQT
jgi:hypothetical protein